MPQTISLDLDVRNFRRRVRTLTDDQVPRVVSIALNKVAFEVRDAEKREVETGVGFADGRGRSFLAGSFRFNKARKNKLQVELFPLSRSEPILRDHREGVPITATGDTAAARRLALAGFVAIPLPGIRTSRGKVRKRDFPGVEFSKRNRKRRVRKRSGSSRSRRKPFVVEFKSGKKAVARRRGAERNPLDIVMLLVPRAKLSPRFDFYRVARETARRELPSKMRAAFQKISRR